VLREDDSRNCQTLGVARQSRGIPQLLKYTKAVYGPYAENLRQVLARIEGHLVSGYLDGGDAPDKQLHLVPGAVQDAAAFLITCPIRELDLNESPSCSKALRAPSEWSCLQLCTGSPHENMRKIQTMPSGACMPERAEARIL